jgi:hypothetical protein
VTTSIMGQMLATARRSQCIGWWNDAWRDIASAAVGVLAHGADTIDIGVGQTATLHVNASPLHLKSPA